MIILDTHIWIWWVANQSKLSEKQLNYLKVGRVGSMGINLVKKPLINAPYCPPLQLKVGNGASRV